ncbi:MAG: flagellin lysine-N-methylase [Marinobacterium sp.]|nr:flagellin lysine-N-methylase [Marinobacterium sp.]
MTRRYKLELLNSYENFKCIGSDCDFTCCSSWQIDIDKPTHEKYIQSDKQQGTRLTEHLIATDAGATIRLNERGECPLIQEDGLCSVVCQLDETYLGNHCTVYPRMRLDYNQSATSRIMLSISCQEASRLTVFNPEPVRLVRDFSEQHSALQIPLLADSYHASDNRHEGLLHTITENFVKLIQLRSVPMKKRLATVIFLTDQAQQYQLNESIEHCQAFNNEVVALLKSQLTTIPDDIATDRYNQFDLVTRISRLLLKTIQAQPIIYPVDHKVSQLITQSLQGLAIEDANHLNGQHYQNYLDAGQRYVTPYLDRNPHIMENLVGYHLLKGNLLFPAEQNRMSPLLLIMLYVLLIIGLSHGYARYHGTLDDEKLNELIFSLHRFIDHSQGTQTFLAGVCEKLSATSPEQMYTFFD